LKFKDLKHILVIEKEILSSKEMKLIHKISIIREFIKTNIADSDPKRFSINLKKG
jgi:DNA-directed RNA polymerase subunit H (RpoH/RPB5)